MPVPSGNVFRPSFVRAAAMVFLVSAVLAGCAGQVPTPEEIQADENDSRYAQIMRIAETTRAGGDLSGAATFYRRAHTMAPERPEPLLALGETSAVTRHFTAEAGSRRLPPRLLRHPGPNAVLRWKEWRAGRE